MEFFRHCPECGGRFHIKLEEKKLVDVETTTVPRTHMAPPIGGRDTGQMAEPTGLLRNIEALTLEQGAPIVVDVEEFRYKYLCKHCGHEWSEEHFRERHAHKTGD